MSGQPASCVESLLPLFDVDPKQRQRLEFGRGWECYSIQRADGADPPVPVILVAAGPKSLAELKKEVKTDQCVVLFAPKETLLVRAANKSCSVLADREAECRRIKKTLESCNISGAAEIGYRVGLSKAIDKLQTQNSTCWDNRGIFSNHYLKNRLWDDLRRDVSPEAEAARRALGNGAEPVLEALGWSLERAEKDGKTYRFENVSVIVAPAGDLSVRTRSDVAPSYTAVAELKHTDWVVLTNGEEWRLYTRHVSASTTNYLAVYVGEGDLETLKCLAVFFGADTYRGKPLQITEILEQSRTKAQSLEEDLRSKILATDGLFLDIAKGMMDHDMKKRFDMADLAKAKEDALAVLYRTWFILYAESRNLLPVSDPRYGKLSLQSMRAKLDGYEQDPDGDSCWRDLSALFDGIRDGSPEHNLPQYAGDLFQKRLDAGRVRNRFMARALRSLSETDVLPVDYGDLGVRHLGNIYEALLEFDIRQAGKDIMLLEDKDGVREVESKEESTYSYKKNDLYLASGRGIASRKTSASFYTPTEIVSFLVRRGLEPILAKRRRLVAGDIEKHKADPSKKNYFACIDRLLDLQVLDPAMGSGHFLVEALNQITQWATEMLNSHPDHPLVAEIESDRQTVIQEQSSKGVTIDANLLTADVLLKRRIMKRCIFGVDLNPLAVDLARLSLWLDSFAIGVPLTYLDHHIKQGDSTIGEWLARMKDTKTHSLDEWFPDPAEHGSTLARVSYSPDITVKQARASRAEYAEYEERIRMHREALDALTAYSIDPSVFPKREKMHFISRLARPSSDKAVVAAKRRIAELAERYSFFHWELEMMDAFTDSRRGFDLVVGNPPWEKSKPYRDEFFTAHDPSFRSLKPSTKKTARANTLLKKPKIRQSYDAYTESFRHKAAFYKTYEMQGPGDTDLWQLVLERTMALVTDGGTISVLVPSQVFANVGATGMRRRLLDMDIVQAYVFENRKKIFDIHSSYRFVLLTVKNQPGPDEFKAAFYLHYLDSLEHKTEKSKFTVCSKSVIKKISPADLIIPEVSPKAYAILAKLSKCRTLGSVSSDGWQIKLSNGFHTTNDAHLFREDGTGWPVLGGRNIHQFNHLFETPSFAIDKSAGLSHLERKKVYERHCSDFHESYMIVFRDMSSSTNMRTMIASIIPPHRFHLSSMRSIVLTRAHRAAFDIHYHRRIAYLLGVINSLTFDFISRTKVQMVTAPVIKHLPVPGPSAFDHEMGTKAARLTGGGGGVGILRICRIIRAQAGAAVTRKPHRRHRQAGRARSARLRPLQGRVPDSAGLVQV